MSSVVESIRVSLPYDGKFSKVHEMVDGFHLSEQQMTAIMNVMENEMKLGLSREAFDRKKSSLQMENTFVHQTIDGTEHGDYMALDLGGTNFRVLYAQMREGKLVSTKSHNYEIPNTILKGTGEGLFDYLADSVAKMIKDENIVCSSPIPLGFTFSFPMVQKSLNNALLLTWTKKFNCSNTVGNDVVQMLEDSIERRGDINVHVVAILNDAVGTLMAGAYKDHESAIGLIMGTGCNASYMEKLDRVAKWEGEKMGDQEIIDIEWGAFGDNGVLDFFKTEYDFEVDELSNHKGSFTFEKLFAGLYMGEVVRCTLHGLYCDGLIFDDNEEYGWVKEHGTFLTKYVSMIESESEDETAVTEQVLHSLGVSHPSADDVAILKYICALVSNRAAKILSSTLCVLLRHINKPRVTIAVDGSLFEKHPTIRPQMEQLIRYLKPSTETKFIHAADGSGLGAAYVAAVADRMEKQGLIDTHQHPEQVETPSLSSMVHREKIKKIDTIEQVKPVVGPGFDVRSGATNMIPLNR